MRRARNRALVALVIAALLSALALPAAGSTQAHVSAHAATGVIVRWESGASKGVSAALASRGLRVQRTLYGNRGAVVAIPEGVDATTLTRSLASIPGVRIAAEDRQVMKPLWTPNDPRFPEQWAYSRIQATSAWDVELGESFVTVGVIDTGADLTHPELVGALDLTRDRDFVSDDTTADDLNGHGTHVSGIIAAASDNATGVAGTAPGVKIVPIKVIGRYTGSTSDFIDGLYYAADLGVDVANMSLGSTASDLGASGVALMQEAVDYAYSKGVVMVAAAGNENSTDIYYPGACDHVICVSATDPADVRATYSNHGPAVDIAAPGGGATASTGILSTYVRSGQHTYANLSGTSMASPFVAATAALLRSHVPAATPAEVETALLSSAKDLGDPGWDELYGYGLLQMRDALDALEAPSPAVTRIAGADRYATAIAQSVSGFASDTVTTAVLASGEDFPDALTGSSLAGAYGSPLLLTKRASLPPGLLAELSRLGATQVVVVGGSAAVSSEVLGEIESAGITVRRIAGADRYATAAAVAEELELVVGAPSVHEAFLARGDRFPDAIAVSPLSASHGVPVLLTRPSTMPTATAEALASIQATEVVIVGSVAAVSAEVATAVSALPGMTVTRWAGADRYETTAQVARNGIARGWVSAEYFGIATGSNFPDALGGGALAAHAGGVVLLSAPTALPASARLVIQDLGHDAVPVAIYGSTAAISNNVAGDLMRIRY